jgi:hypothetical protein
MKTGEAGAQSLRKQDMLKANMIRFRRGVGRDLF